MRILAAILFFVCSAANAQFVTGQILTAAQLNAAFANVLALSGGTLTGPLTVQGATTVANLTVNGAFTIPGGFSPSSLAPQAANTDLANVTGSSSSPAAVPIPSCSAANSAVKYTSGTGWGCGATFALTSGTLAQFSATTSAQLAGIISDETGSGPLVFGASPTLTTPVLGTPTSATLTNATGLPIATGVSGLGTGVATALGTAVTGSGGPVLATSPTITTPNITGVTSGGNATAGSVGEYITANATSVAAFGSGTAGNITSISLTAGDWDVTGIAIAVGGTTVTSVGGGISTASATFGAFGTYASQVAVVGQGAAVTPPVRISITSTTTIYLVANCAYTGTPTMSGLIRARRVR